MISLYYEAHITIEPVFDNRLIKFEELCKEQKFRVAKLLMQKRKEDTPERSSLDSFCTSRDIDFDVLKTRTLDLVNSLEANDFKVWRYKIEDTLIDSRHDDSARPLPNKKQRGE